MSEGRKSKLRGFQQAVKYSMYAEWAKPDCRVVMPVMPTGAGKTVLMADIAYEYPGYGVAVAHRSELVGQISIALAREGVRHDIIAPKSVIRNIVQGHMLETGNNFFDNRARWKVASVDTIIRRDIDPNFIRQCGLGFIDEGHHVLRDNKWGKAIGMFPNARWALPTATPDRADGRGLGAHADGVVNALVEGPTMRWIIDNGYLTDYLIRAPDPSDLHMEDVAISATTGDYNVDQMRAKVKANNRIIGDVVNTYLRYARGLRGITFAVDVEHATQIAAEYNRNGVPAAVVHAETLDTERNTIMQKFRRGELLQLVNVDLFGEGVDVPACQVVSMARPTASYALYVQQFGRALRLMISPMLAAAWDTYTPEQRKRFIAESGKPVAMIFDHVGNVVRHMGPPDRRQKPWTLDRRERRTRATDGIPFRTCTNEACLQPYERIHPACPHCGMEPPPPKERSKPEFVDGDIMLYTQELLDELFGKVNKIDSDFIPIPPGSTPVVAASIKKNHRERQEAQRELRATMQLVMPPTVDERVNQRKFFHTYGVDALTAQTLGSSEAVKLRQQILEKVTGK